MKKPTSLAGVSPYRHSALARYEDSILTRSFPFIRFCAMAVLGFMIFAVPVTAMMLADHFLF